jgi:hypothetical protein
MGNIILFSSKLLDECLKDTTIESYFTQQEFIYDPIARSFANNTDDKSNNNLYTNYYKYQHNELDTIYELSENSSSTNSPISPISSISINSNSPIIYNQFVLTPL